MCRFQAMCDFREAFQADQPVALLSRGSSAAADVCVGVDDHHTTLMVRPIATVGAPCHMIIVASNVRVEH